MGFEERNKERGPHVRKRQGFTDEAHGVGEREDEKREVDHLLPDDRVRGSVEQERLGHGLGRDPALEPECDSGEHHDLGQDRKQQLPRPFVERVDDEAALDEHGEDRQQERLSDDGRCMGIEPRTAGHAKVRHGARDETAAESLKEQAILRAHHPCPEVAEGFQRTEQGDDLQQSDDSDAVDDHKILRDNKDGDPQAREDGEVEQEFFVAAKEVQQKSYFSRARIFSSKSPSLFSPVRFPQSPQ